MFGLAFRGFGMGIGELLLLLLCDFGGAFIGKRFEGGRGVRFVISVVE